MEFTTDKNGVLLIDTSSLIFSIIFRLRGKYLQFKENLAQEEKDLKINEESFILKNFSKNFCESVNVLVKNYQTKELIFARDDNRERIWRVKRFPKYKSNRKKFTRHKKENIELGPVFSAIYQTQYDNLIKSLGAISIKVAEAEADDVIAVLTKFFSDQNQRVVIVADDFDYYQLMVYPEVEVYDNRGNSFFEKSGQIPPIVFSQLKILRGDKSDNIPSCQILIDERKCRVVDDMGIIGRKILSFIEAKMLLKMNVLQRKSVSIKMAKELQQNPQKILDLLEKDPLFLETFRRNSELIDMKNIPHNIVFKILRSYSMEIFKYTQSMYMKVDMKLDVNLAMSININQQVIIAITD